MTIPLRSVPARRPGSAEKSAHVSIETEGLAGAPANQMETLKRVAVPFLLSRLLVCFLLAAPLLVSIQPVPTPADAGMIYHLQPAPESPTLLQKLQTVLHSADGAWYEGIAEGGYAALEPEQQTRPNAYTDTARNWTFFPLLPLIERLTAPITGSAFRSGLIAAYLFFLGSLIVIHKLARAYLFSPAAADRAVLLLCFFPYSYFYSFPLTESLFLYLTALAFLQVKRGRPLAAGAAMALASATRPTGLLLLPGFLIELLKERNYFRSAPLQSGGREFAAILIAPIGAVLFSAYLWQHTGNPLAFSENQQAWGRAPISLGGLYQSLAAPFHSAAAPWNFTLFNGLAAYLSILCAAWSVKKREYGWALVILVPLVASLGTGITQSFGRFTAASFPVFLVLAALTERPAVERAVLAVFAALLGAMTIGRALYVTSLMC